MIEKGKKGNSVAQDDKKSTSEPDDKKDKTSKDKMGMGETHAALHVTSVKMIAATCS